MYITMIAIVRRCYTVTFLYRCLGFLFYDDPVYVRTWAFLTKSQCRISDAHVIVKAREPCFDNHVTTFVEHCIGIVGFTSSFVKVLKRFQNAYWLFY